MVTTVSRAMAWLQQLLVDCPSGRSPRKTQAIFVRTASFASGRRGTVLIAFNERHPLISANDYFRVVRRTFNVSSRLMCKCGGRVVLFEVRRQTQE